MSAAALVALTGCTSSDPKPTEPETASAFASAAINDYQLTAKASDVDASAGLICRMLLQGESNDSIITTLNSASQMTSSDAALSYGFVKFTHDEMCADAPFTANAELDAALTQ
jgi:hypothetical protein